MSFHNSSSRSPEWGFGQIRLSDFESDNFHAAKPKHYSQAVSTPFTFENHTAKNGKKRRARSRLSGPSIKPLKLPSRLKRGSTSDIVRDLDFESHLLRLNASDTIATRWLLEILSWSISFLCISGVIVVLIVLNDKELPTLPFGITLNAFISVLVRVASAALLIPVTEALGQLKWIWFKERSRRLHDFELFDEATRGPWGSMILLFRTKLRSLAAIGAAITILVLALDAFFQQVVVFPQRWVILDDPEVTGQAQLPITSLYMSSRDEVRTEADGKKVLARNQDQLNTYMAFYFGNGTQELRLGNGTRPNYPISCPTSNCTWPLYNSLGMCSACEDVSDLLQWNCSNSVGDWVSTELGLRTVPGVGGLAPIPYIHACGWFLNSTSDNPILMVGYQTDSTYTNRTNETLTMRMMPLVTNPERLWLWNGSIHFKNMHDPFIDFITVGVKGGFDGLVYRNETPVAKECVLTWCTKTFKSSFVQGSYFDDVVSTLINTTMQTYPWYSKWTSDYTIATGYHQDIVIKPDNLNMSGEGSTTFGCSNETALASIFVADLLLPAYLTAANSTAEPMLRTSNSFRRAVLTKYPINYWLENDITKYMDRFAEALTDNIRAFANGSDLVNGTVSDLKIFVEARWVWLLLPLFLLFSTLAFLVATMIQSSRNKEHVGIWKNSAMATLLYGLPMSVKERAGEMTEVGTPRLKAREFKVKLLEKHSWRLSTYSTTPLSSHIENGRQEQS